MTKKKKKEVKTIAKSHNILVAKVMALALVVSFIIIVVMCSRPVEKQSLETVFRYKAYDLVEALRDNNKDINEKKAAYEQALKDLREDYFITAARPAGLLNEINRIDSQIIRFENLRHKELWNWDKFQALLDEIMSDENNNHSDGSYLYSPF